MNATKTSATQALETLENSINPLYYQILSEDWYKALPTKEKNKLYNQIIALKGNLDKILDVRYSQEV